MNNLKSVSMAIVVACIIGVSSVATADQAKDLKITMAVKSALAAEPDIPASDIQVRTDDGVVSLSGSLDTRLQLYNAVEVAQSVDGVKYVDDHNLNSKSSTDYLADALTTAKVKGKLKQLQLNKRIGSHFSLHVETTNGVVHILGKIDKPKDAKTIKNAISQMDNVKDVRLNVSTQS